MCSMRGFLGHGRSPSHYVCFKMMVSNHLDWYGGIPSLGNHHTGCHSNLRVWLPYPLVSSNTAGWEITKMSFESEWMVILWRLPHFQTHPCRMWLSLFMIQQSTKGGLAKEKGAMMGMILWGYSSGFLIRLVVEIGHMFFFFFLYILPVMGHQSMMKCIIIWYVSKERICEKSGWVQS